MASVQKDSSVDKNANSSKVNSASIKKGGVESQLKSLLKRGAVKGSRTNSGSKKRVRFNSKPEIREYVPDNRSEGKQISWLENLLASAGDSDDSESISESEVMEFEEFIRLQQQFMDGDSPLAYEFVFQENEEDEEEEEEEDDEYDGPILEEIEEQTPTHVEKSPDQIVENSQIEDESGESCSNGESSGDSEIEFELGSDIDDFQVQELIQKGVLEFVTDSEDSSEDISDEEEHDIESTGSKRKNPSLPTGSSSFKRRKYSSEEQP